MEKCKLCNKELYNGKDLSPIIDGDNSKGSVHQACRNTAISLAIIEKEAERAKVPTLEERAWEYAIAAEGVCSRETIDVIIAMARKHDAVLADESNWKARYYDEKAAREKAEAKLTKIATALKE